MRILKYTTDTVKTPNGNSVLAVGSIYAGDLIDFLVYKEDEFGTGNVNLAIKIGSEDEDFETGQLPENFSFSNGYSQPAIIWKAPSDVPEESLKGYWVIIFYVPFGLEDIINEAILACGYWRGYKEGEKK